MTTVVCDRKSMSSDSQSTTGHQMSDVTKLFRSPEGHVIGICGEYETALEFKDYLCGDRKKCPKHLEEVEALVLTTEGKIIHYYGSKKPIVIRSKYAAIGTGSDAALGAMYLGDVLRKPVSPAQAIRAACKVDAYSSGKVQSLMPL